MFTILVGSVVVFAFGALWFTVLFGKTWAKLMDFNPAGDAKAKEMGMAKPLVINFLLNVLVVGVVYLLVPELLPLSFPEFLKAVLILWVGFSFPIYANAAVWERKSWKLVAINSVQSILAISIVSAVVYYMQ